MVRLWAVMGEEAARKFNPPGDETAWYCVMGNPPSFEGGVNEMVAPPGLATAVTPVGGSGTVDSGITSLDGAEAAPSPFALVAVTVKVCATPLASPAMVTGELEPVALTPPTLEVTVYE